MKKTIICLLFGVLSGFQVDANPVYAFNKIKSKAVGTLLLAKTKIVDALSSVIDSNQVKIEKALEAKEAVFKISEKFQLGIDGEDALLKNIKSFGFDKKNALSALRLMKKYYTTIKSLENRYVFVWNKTLKMDEAIAEVLPSLQISKLYKVYLEGHQDCLRGWELVELYKNIELVDAVDTDSAIYVTSLWYKNNDNYSLIKSIDLLSADISYIETCLNNKYYHQAYPKLRKQLFDFLPTLKSIVELVKKSSEYHSEYFYKTNKPMLSPQKVEELEENEVVAVLSGDANEEKKENTVLMGSMNPFHDFEANQD